VSKAALSVPDAAELAARFSADSVILYAIEGQDLGIVDIWPVHPSAKELKLQVGFGVTGRVARTRRPLLLHEDSPRNPLHRELIHIGPNETVARMCVPLPGLRGGLEEGVFGVLALTRPPRRPFTPDDLERAQAFAPILGLHLHAEQLWRAVNRHRTERDRLIKQAISAQEAERRRIAFDLHDGVTTALASMAFHLSAADLTVAQLATADATVEADAEKRKLGLERARAELGSARALADMAYAQTRAAISGLHSLVLDDLGLTAAFESLVQMASRDDGPRIDLVVDPAVERDDVPDHAAAAFYRIAQESLANAVKHAGATRIRLSLRRDGDSIVLNCSDDGQGFDLEAQRSARAADDEGEQHFGLSSVAERCAMIEASLRVESRPGGGTIVMFELPL
jgi:signal transduction histidine kinase